MRGSTRGRGISFGRNVFRRFNRGKPGLLTVNHFEQTTSTAAATELLTPLGTGIKTPTNRGVDLPEGAVLTKIVCRLWATDATPVTGKHQCLLYYRPGAETLPAPIASWYVQTDPATEDMIDIRRNIMSRPHTDFIVTGEARSARFTCYWKGRKTIYDGDDFMLSQLDTNATNWALEVYTQYIQ